MSIAGGDFEESIGSPHLLSDCDAAPSMWDGTTGGSNLAGWLAELGEMTMMMMMMMTMMMIIRIMSAKFSFCLVVTTYLFMCL